LKDSCVEQNFGFAANDLVVLFDLFEPGNGPRFKHRALPSDREKSEQEIQRRKQQDVIGKIFVKRKPVAAPLIKIGEGTGINGRDSCEWVIDHHAPPLPGQGIISTWTCIPEV